MLDFILLISYDDDDDDDDFYHLCYTIYQMEGSIKIFSALAAVAQRVEASLRIKGS